MVYTGLVQCVGKATANSKTFEISVKAPGFFKGSKLGDSIAVNGVCLTLVKGWTDDVGLFFVMGETRTKTNLFLNPDTEFDVNLELSMRVGDSLGGHYVMGHVFGLGNVVEVNQRKDGSRDVWISFDNVLDMPSDAIVHKGSITVDGTSLTVAQVKGNTFRVSLIPHTLAHTNLSDRKVGDAVNLEFDIGHSHNDQAEANGEEKEMTHDDYMRIAISEGEKGRLTAPPNPWVGCVLVKDGEIIGKGYHSKAGTAHAEIKAFENAEASGNGDKIKGCTLYTTLEPCHHQGRTGPCDVAVASRGVAQVVISVVDPDNKVEGKGIQFLKDKGIQVLTGVCVWEAEQSLRSYLYHRRTSLPYCIVKVALSLDGKIACGDGTSQWITGEAARKHVHCKLRAPSQAIIVGSGTAIADNPRLNVRGVEAEVKPLRVVLDTYGKVVTGSLMDTSVGPTLIFTTKDASKDSLEAWKKFGVDVEVIKKSENGVDLSEVLRQLGKRGILQVLIEGGAKVHSSAIKFGLCNSVSLYYGSCMLGSTAKHWFQSPIAETMKEVQFMDLDKVVQLENDIYLQYTTKQ